MRARRSQSGRGGGAGSKEVQMMTTETTTRPVVVGVDDTGSGTQAPDTQDPLPAWQVFPSGWN